MKQILISLLSGILILTACASATPASTALPSPSGTPTLVPVTFTPSLTQIPLTETLTPLPTIPTFTPTFDARTIVTVTPAAQAECPTEKPEKRFLFDATVYDQNFYKKILYFLNTGGSRRAVLTAYRQQYKWADDGIIQEKDVTADGIADLLFTDFGFFAAYICESGQYQVKFLLGETYHFTTPFIITAKDMNLDGIIEIVVAEGDARVMIVSVFAWDGNDFKKVNEPECPSQLYGPSQVEISDTNSDGMLELILKQGIPIWSEYYEGLPWRKEKRTCAWDGKQFVLAQVELAPPEYRFQAVQDGDLATLQNEFNKALSLYQEAIRNNELSSFSPEILQNLRANLDSQIGPNPSPSSTPYPSDITEYPKLAAYAYYRILLHLVQGHESEARITYSTLQEKFGNDPYGHPYVEMATTFWETYQPTHKMYDGCAAAIEYAVEHPEILLPLGSDYHGSQSHIYVPADVCPFR